MQGVNFALPLGGQISPAVDKRDARSALHLLTCIVSIWGSLNGYARTTLGSPLRSPATSVNGRVRWRVELISTQER